jgi:hypothetical protein
MVKSCPAPDFAALIASSVRRRWSPSTSQKMHPLAATIISKLLRRYLVLLENITREVCQLTRRKQLAESKAHYHDQGGLSRSGRDVVKSAVQAFLVSAAVTVLLLSSRPESGPRRSLVYSPWRRAVSRGSGPSTGREAGDELVERGDVLRLRLLAAEGEQIGRDV